MEYILQTHELCKKYDSKLVLDKVNMNIKKGDIYGFVGENGSGKTTIIRLITGLIFPTSGSFTLFGVHSSSKEILKARAKIGAIVETPSIYTNFSAKENLKLQCTLLGKEADNSYIDSLLDKVGLIELANSNKKAGDFSLGMRQRLGIAMSLAINAEFIILDEPMNGLDPAGIVEIRELILKLNKEHNVTFLISSHLLSELSLIATRYGIISKGKIIKEVTIDEIEKECQPLIDFTLEDAHKVCEILNKKYEIEQDSNHLRILNVSNINEVLKDILDCGVAINDIKTSKINIEEYYLQMIGDGKNA